MVDGICNGNFPLLSGCGKGDGPGKFLGLRSIAAGWFRTISVGIWPTRSLSAASLREFENSCFLLGSLRYCTEVAMDTLVYLTQGLGVSGDDSYRVRDVNQAGSRAIQPVSFCFAMKGLLAVSIDQYILRSQGEISKGSSGNRTVAGWRADNLPC